MAPDPNSPPKTSTLLWAAIKNARCKAMNRSLVGWKTERALAPIRLEDAQAFARACRDDNPAYTGADAVAPPFFFARLVFPSLVQAMLHPDLKLNLLRMVHGEMDVRWERPLRPGDALKVTMEIAAVEDTRAGELLRLAGEMSAGGAPVVRARAGLLVRGKAKRGGSKPADEPAPAEAFRREVPTEDGQQRAYAEASGDRNFIHTSGLLARLAGLPRTIMHGMCVLAMTASSLVDELGDGDPRRLAAISGRFARPVLPGQTLTVIGHPAEGDGTPFSVLGPAAKPAIKNGLVQIR